MVKRVSQSDWEASRRVAHHLASKLIAAAEAGEHHVGMQTCASIKAELAEVQNLWPNQNVSIRVREEEVGLVFSRGRLGDLSWAGKL